MRLFPTRLLIATLILMMPLFTMAQQDFQGKAYYQTKTTMDLDNWGRGQMSEQQKKQIMERMKSFLEKQYILTFTQSESIYKEDEKLEAPGAGGRGFGMMSSFTGGAQYKNVKEKQQLQEQEFFGKQFLIKDSLPDLVWEMGTETKQIGQYTCFKATAVKKVDEFDWSSMRRRDRDKEEGEKKKDSTETADAKSDNPMDEIEVPKEIVVTAWYTPQIPVNNGPGEYWGLPGLILEINADRTTMLCTKIVLNPDEKDDIKKPSKGKEVTRKEYNDIFKQKMEEMREMYGGRRGGGRGH
ncbi:GLPGLI family protein [Hanstruepera neustonica]|uniref:GLPGLI family protein n=1 Tax=Hanstruepera neustonica TaxID=1445657 RepID=A0A2K1E0Y1_9FLAO|nr:GLPGLI family protein [Hanstruepera neustonica]PNQ73928.1 GLPGLI family protein [Hanstruepera neustonica]